MSGSSANSHLAYEWGLFVFAEYATGACFIVAAYDWILGLSREIECIWWAPGARRRKLVPTIMYTWLRYCCILIGAFNAFPIHITTYWLGATFSLLNSFGISIFSTLRVYALYGKINIATILVFMFAFVDPAINIYHFTRPSRIFVGPPVGCQIQTANESWFDPYFPIVVRTSDMIGDAIVLAATWYKTADTWKTSRQLKHFKPTITYLILRDGTLYFTVLLLLNLTITILDIVQLYDPWISNATNLIAANQVVAPILIARFILNLQSAAYGANQDDTFDTANTPTVVFAGHDIQSMMGNLGAVPGAWNTTGATNVDTDVGDESTWEKEHRYSTRQRHTSVDDIELEAYSPS